MTAIESRPDWWRPGMSAEEAEEIEWWEAAERAVAQAPVIRPESPEGMRLRPLLADLGEGIRAARTARDRRDTAA